jgi:hypothetical protein
MIEQLLMMRQVIAESTQLSICCIQGAPQARLQRVCSRQVFQFMTWTADYPQACDELLGAINSGRLKAPKSSKTD